MPDELTRWERVLSRGEEEARFQAKQSTAHLLQADKPNPYKLEAQRDRALIFWALAVLGLAVLIAILLWQILFV